MKHIQKKDAQAFQNSTTCYGVSYQLNDPDIDAALIYIDGRYPEKGRTLNENCKEMVYVVKGNGKIHVEDKEYKLEKDNVILIEKGERYYFEGKMEIFVPCTPAWYPEQHKMVQ